MVKQQGFSKSAVRFDAFISYSHTDDTIVAEAIQREIQRLAKPWYRLRAATVFRDEINLAASPHLWRDIQERLDSSQYFILLASPASASSKWVQKEMCYWLTSGAKEDPSTLTPSEIDINRSERTIIVVTDGTIKWDDFNEDFLWSETTAVPRILSLVFSSEPLWVDLRWAKALSKSELTRGNVEFMNVVARVSSPIRNLDVAMLIGTDVIEHRRTLRQARMAIVVLTVLVCISIIASFSAIQQRRLAEKRLGDAVNAANHLMKIAQSDLKRIPGAGQVRNDLLESSRLLLNNLTAESGNDLQLMESRWKNLGIHGDLSMDRDNLDSAKTKLDKAVRIGDSLLEIDPDNPWYISGVQVTYEQRGNLLKALGDSLGATSAFRRSFELAQSLIQIDPDNDDYQAGIAAAYNTLGINAATAELANPAFEEARTIALRLLKTNPNWDKPWTTLSIATGHQGELAARQGDYERAKVKYEEAINAMSHLTRYQPLNTKLNLDLTALKHRLGGLLKATGQLDLARQTFQQVIDIIEPMLEIDSSNMEFQRALGYGYKGLAEVEDADSRFEEAEKAYLSAIMNREMLMKSDPHNIEYFRELHAVYIGLGDLYLENELIEQAQELYKKGLLLDQAEIDESQANWNQLQDRAAMFNRLANIAEARNSTKEADGYHHEALRLAQLLVGKHESKPEALRTLIVCHVNLAQFFNSSTSKDSMIIHLQEAEQLIVDLEKDMRFKGDATIQRIKKTINELRSLSSTQ